MKLAFVCTSGLACITVTAALACVAFSPVIRGNRIGCNGPGLAYVAPSLAKTRQFASLMDPKDRAALRSVDYRKNVVVAAFHCFGTPEYKARVRDIRRAGAKVNVVMEYRTPSGGFAIPTTYYDVVQVKRSSLKAPLPGRADLRIVPSL